MRDILNLRDFKCFTEHEIELGNLTILAGTNGAGKSTVVQAILLLRSILEHTTGIKASGTIGLNDRYGLQLGTFEDIMNHKATSLVVSIRYSEQTGKEAKLTLRPADNDLSLQSCFELEVAEEFTMARQPFRYLNAERLGPRLSQPMVTHNYWHTGIHGQYLAQVLDENIKIDEYFIYDPAKDKSLELDRQTNQWLSYILGDFRLKGYKDLRIQAARLEIESRQTTTQPVLPTNMAFGVSYCAPIIVSALLSKPKDWLVVENPEAHLHPGAQSRIGRFLAKVADFGVRVILETHSEHILQGVQLAIASQELAWDKASLLFFEREMDSKEPVARAIRINQLGELSSWPRGFFDQSQQDLVELIKLRKANKV